MDEERLNDQITCVVNRPGRVILHEKVPQVRF